jgi:hypothetical protein
MNIWLTALASGCQASAAGAQKLPPDGTPASWRNTSGASRLPADGPKKGPAARQESGKGCGVMRLPWIAALAVTHGVAAYVILPRVLRIGLKILQRKHVLERSRAKSQKYVRCPIEQEQLPSGGLAFGFATIGKVAKAEAPTARLKDATR